MENKQSGEKRAILEALTSEMVCGCQIHGFLEQSNCHDCQEANTKRFNFFYDFGKEIRTYVINQLVNNPAHTEFRISFTGTKIIIHQMNVDCETIDVPLFQDPRNLLTPQTPTNE